MSEPFLGEIRMVGFNFAPSGWMLCNGQTLAINAYAALFSLLGTTFGGNGTSTFQLPDLQGRVPVNVGNGAGLSPVVWGEVFGQPQVTLNQSNLPAHAHTITPPATNSAGNLRPRKSRRSRFLRHSPSMRTLRQRATAPLWRVRTWPRIRAASRAAILRSTSSRRPWESTSSSPIKASSHRKANHRPGERAVTARSLLPPLESHGRQQRKGRADG